MKKRLRLSRWVGKRDNPAPFLKKETHPSPTDPEKSREQEARLEALINSIDQIVFELDADGTYLNIWTTDEKLLYRPRHELLGKRSEDIFDADFFRSSHEIFKRVIATGKGEDFEYSLDFETGKRWFLARVNRIHYPDGDDTVCMAVREITDRKRTEENLRVSEEKFSKAFHSGPDAIVISTLAEGKILDVNDGFSRLTGYSSDEAIGRTSLDIGIWVNPKDRDQMITILKRQGEVRDLEIRFSVKSGEARTFLMSAHTIELNNSLCLIAILRDVTERKALEEQLRQSQKMEAVGRLAGGVAHDFNNLLVGILGYSELLKKKLPAGDDDLQRMTEEINAAAMRARDLTSRLLALSHRQVLRPAVLDLNVLVRQCERLLRPILGEDVHMILRLDPKTANVKADPAQLEQVILNLALNARDAMPGSGTLSMETCNIQVDAALARQHPGLIPGFYVRLSVTDTGHGIAPDVMPRIFEPFFTTKEIGKGSGLGLSTVYGVVKQSGGCVTVSSQPGLGAAFGIYLPRASELPERRISAQPAAASSTGTETILLVEDEAVVRDLVCEILRESGYVVLSANSGADAMETTAEHIKPIDLLITDVVMPEMSGPELANILRRARGEMRVLYMSGYTDDAVLVRQGLPENSAFIRKPYTPQQFLQKVRETLDATPRRAH